MLVAENISKSFTDRASGRRFDVLQDVSLRIAQGEAVALMGGSGSGKSTLARILLRLLPSDGGRLCFDGTDITQATGKSLRSFRRAVQFISQRPEGFLDPRQTLGASIREAFSVFSLPCDEQWIAQMLELVKLNTSLLTRYPHQVSGGEIQRVCIARALLLQPRLLLLDEPTSMLDISVQAQILHLLRDIRREHNLAYLFITHDRQLAQWLCDRTLYIERGRVQ